MKRMIRRSSNNAFLLKDSCELETIPEGTELPLTLASPQHRINIEMNATGSQSSGTGSSLNKDSYPGSSLSSLSTAAPLSDFDADQHLLNNHLPIDSAVIDLKLHGLSREELFYVQRSAKDEKKQLRRMIKDREQKFMQVNGRPMAKSESKSHEDYVKYRTIKAKLKLIDALLSKSGKP